MKKQLDKIREVDPVAAEYIENIVVPRYPPGFIEKMLKGNSEILDMFLWEFSVQGWEYWFNIWRKTHGSR